MSVRVVVKVRIPEARIHPGQLAGIQRAIVDDMLGTSPRASFNPSERVVRVSYVAASTSIFVALEDFEDRTMPRLIRALGGLAIIELSVRQT